MGVYRRLQGYHWLVRIECFPYFFRDTEEAIVGDQMAFSDC